MLKTILAFAVFMTAATASSGVFAQMQMTSLPSRLEEALINPDLSSVLRNGPPAIRPRSKTAAIAENAKQYRTAKNSFSQAAFGTTKNQYRRPALPPAAAPQSALLPRPADSIPDIAKLTKNDAARAAQQELSTATQVAGNSKQLDKLQVRITGAAAMIESQPVDFTVRVTNPTDAVLGPVDVNVQVPDTITITRFARDAWLDDERRIVAFRLDKIAPGKTENIQLRGLSHNVGKTSFRVLLTSGRQMIAEVDQPTRVFPQQVANQLNFGDSPEKPIRK